MTADEWSESTFCERYADTFDSEVYREGPAGNQVFKGFTDIAGFEGALSYRFDLLAEQPTISHPTLVECKHELNFRSLGQILLYTYLIRRDRKLVQQKYERRGNPWVTKSAVQSFDTHVTETSNGYVPKPEIEDITQQIAVGTVNKSATVLPAICTALGIDVVHEETRSWRVLNQNGVFNVSSPSEQGPLQSWLADKSSSRVDGDLENRIAADFLDNLRNHGYNADVYYEIPIGDVGFPNLDTPVRADLVANVDGNWLVVEVKSGEGENTTPKFQTAFGQAVGYAAIFRREWGLGVTEVCPVVLQLPPDPAARWYAKDRYGESARQMWAAGFESETEPMIFHMELNT